MFQCPQCKKSVGLKGALWVFAKMDGIDCPHCNRTVKLTKKINKYVAINVALFLSIQQYMHNENIQYNLLHYIFGWAVLTTVVILILFPVAKDVKDSKLNKKEYIKRFSISLISSMFVFLPIAKATTKDANEINVITGAVLVCIITAFIAADLPTKNVLVYVPVSIGIMFMVAIGIGAIIVFS